MSARREFAVTYDIVTDESAAHGDTADCGFIAQDVTLRDAAGLVGDAWAQADHWPIRAWDRVRSLTFPEYGHESARHFVNGEQESRALHIPAGVTAASSRRIARLFGVTVERMPAPSVPAPFFTSCSGDLVRNDSTCSTVRPRFAWRHREISNARELCATLRAGEFAWPGGYRCAFLTRDGETICYGCARDELSQCVHALRHDTRDAWHIVGLVCKAETDSGETCAHCNAVIWTGADDDDAADDDAADDDAADDDAAARWRRRDIVAAWCRLEADYNVDGWIRERPSNLRRLESCDVQAARCGFDGILLPMTRNAWRIYRNAEARLFGVEVSP